MVAWIMKKSFCGLILPIVLCSLSCASGKQGRIISPEGELPPVAWDANEFQEGITVKILRATDSASYHLIRLKGAEKPHFHDQHDATVTILSGKARIHYGDKALEVRKGDVVEIPRGQVHWAENLGKEACIVYAVFTPPFDGKDYRLKQN